VNAEDNPGGTDRVRIEPGSLLIGQTLRQARLPISIIVTSILRKRDLVVPTGSTVLEVGDELVVIGRSADIEVIQKITADRCTDVDGPGPSPDSQGECPPGPATA
jgi:NhaP-type Na+/H+ and K+/H+ antiporter